MASSSRPEDKDNNKDVKKADEKKKDSKQGPEKKKHSLLKHIHLLGGKKDKKHEGVHKPVARKPVTDPDEISDELLEDDAPAPSPAQTKRPREHFSDEDVVVLVDEDEQNETPSKEHKEDDKHKHDHHHNEKDKKAKRKSDSDHGVHSSQAPKLEQKHKHKSESGRELDKVKRTETATPTYVSPRQEHLAALQRIEAKLSGREFAGVDKQAALAKIATIKGLLEESFDERKIDSEFSELGKLVTEITKKATELLRMRSERSSSLDIKAEGLGKQIFTPRPVPPPKNVDEHQLNSGSGESSGEEEKEEKEKTLVKEEKKEEKDKAKAKDDKKSDAKLKPQPAEEKLILVDEAQVPKKLDTSDLHHSPAALFAAKNHKKSIWAALFPCCASKEEDETKPLLPSGPSINRA